MPEPDPTGPDWVDFLKWLSDEHSYDVDQIISVVEKPWHYEDEYKEYLALGGTER